MKLLEKLFLPPKRIDEYNVKQYIKDIKNDTYRDKFNLGLTDQKKLNFRDFTREPNAIYLGSMGSGKSVAANFTALTWMLANSDQTIMFIVDTVKGAADYQALFECDQVFPVLNSDEKVHRVIDLIYDEAMARREEFSKVQAESITEYERKTGQKIARIVLLMEEFHSIPYNVLNFDKDYKIPMTSANKFHTIMRIGRSMGTWVIACSQKGTKSDIPSEIVPNFTQKQIFRVSKAEAAYFLNDTKAAEITSEQKGRCFTDYGEVQFPFIPIPSQKVLVKEFVKPLNSKCFYMDLELIENYLSGKDTKDLYKLKKLSDLAIGIENFNSELVIKILHERMEHRIIDIDSKIDNFGISMVVEWPNKGRIAIMLRVGGKKITSKHLINLSKGMEYHKCQRGIIYTSAEDLPAAIYKKAVEDGIEVVDHEDLVRLCRQIESNVVSIEQLSPDQLANSLKESGAYQEDHKIKDLSMEEEEAQTLIEDAIDEAEEAKVRAEREAARRKAAQQATTRIAPDAQTTYVKEVVEEISETELMERELEAREHGQTLENPVVPAIDEDPVEEVVEEREEEVVAEEPPTTRNSEVSKIAESLLVPTHRAAVKPVKRLPVRGFFHLQKEEPAELLVHVHRNEGGEVYRVLFQVVVNKKLRHQYFLDKKVKGTFSIKDRARLQIVDTNDWNNQYDEVNRRSVMDEEEFNRSVLEYLDQFKQYEFGNTKAICWAEDAPYVSSLIARSRHMDPSPTKIEEIAKSLYGEEVDRELLFAQNKMNIKRIDIFYSINVDFQIWTMLSP